MEIFEKSTLSGSFVLDAFVRDFKERSDKDLAIVQRERK